MLPERRSGIDPLGHEVGHAPKLLEAVEEVNHRQKTALVTKIGLHFDEKLRGRTFALWGLAFKPDTDDMREAPSRVIIEALLNAGATVRAYDPVALEEAQRLFGDRADLVLCNDAYEVAEGADALLIATEWKEFRSPDFERLRTSLAGAVIFDGRNLYDPSILRRFGFTYYAIGRSNVADGSFGSESQLLKRFDRHDEATPRSAKAGGHPVPPSH